MRIWEIQSDGEFCWRIERSSRFCECLVYLPKLLSMEGNRISSDIPLPETVAC